MEKKNNRKINKKPLPNTDDVSHLIEEADSENEEFQSKLELQRMVLSSLRGMIAKKSMNKYK